MSCLVERRLGQHQERGTNYSSEPQETESAQRGPEPCLSLESPPPATLPGKLAHPSNTPAGTIQGGGHSVQCVSKVGLQGPLSACAAWSRHRASRGDGPHLCLALMCSCRPFRLEARCPHSSHTNSFSPRCLKASCSCSSVRDRKHLAQVGHCSKEGPDTEQGEGGVGLPRDTLHGRTRTAALLEQPAPVSMLAPALGMAWHLQRGAWALRAA